MAHRTRLLAAAVAGSATCLAVLAAAAPAHAAFPGHNGDLAYVETIQGPGVPEGGANEVFTVRRDGTNSRQLTQTGDNDHPRWGPFGHRILYTHLPAGGHSQIWVMGQHGGHKRRLPGQGHTRNTEAAWAPSGHRIVFTRFADQPGSVDLVIYSLDSHKVTALHVGRGFDLIPGQPAWSPDGKLIAFSGLSKGTTNTRGELYVIHPDGTGLTQVTHTPRFIEQSPNWSPDSRMLAYGGNGRVGKGHFCEALFTSNADGTGRNRIHSGCQSMSPAWSPNGRKIVAFISKQSQPGLWIMSPSGRDQRFLVLGGDPDLQPRR